jgi:gamma-glutamyltranspeptidase
VSYFTLGAFFEQRSRSRGPRLRPAPCLSLTYGPDFVRVVVECAKLAFADREAWYGDPGFVDVQMHALLSDQYNDGRRRLVGDSASLELRPGRPEDRIPRVLVGGREAVIAEAEIGEPTMGEPVTTPMGVVASDRATSMLSTAGVTWFRRHRAAAGCRARR